MTNGQWDQEPEKGATRPGSFKNDDETRILKIGATGPGFMNKGATGPGIINKGATGPQKVLKKGV